MKVCNSCKFPLITTKNIVTDVWDWILTQDYSDDVTINEPHSITFTQKECQFLFTITSEPKFKAIEEWSTPFGSHEKNISNNREILDCLNIWYKTLERVENVNVLEAMDQDEVVQLEITKDLCSVCKKKTRPKKVKKKVKKKKKDIRKQEILVAAEVQEVTQKKLEDETLKELIAVAIEERIAAGEKRKITWKDLIKLYLEENIHETKKRHPESIADFLGLEISQVNETLEGLESEGIIQKEFKLFDYYILKKDFNSETARKHLEILDYLKQHVDCPSTKCTQFSISLSFDLPFAIVGFILNAMSQNRLIKKESIEVPTDGVIKKVACYVPSSY
ncbi:MAG: hypothetical protein JSW11_16905 [Candidatus Heimdallarchaeota archaeon]|nr:MAG: hypothetical protein JSW11_16905 [Candidatus Heimdallarchaeota archaeon]